MRRLIRELWQNSRLLVPTNRLRAQLVLLVLIGAAIPVTELLVAKIFTDIVVTGQSKSAMDLVLAVLGFSALFAITRIANYLQKTYRVKFFDKSFKKDTREKSSTKESWEWAMALELVNVLSFFTQMIVIAAFVLYLSWAFGAINFVFVLIVLQIMGMLFKRQLVKQRGYVEKKRAKEDVKAAERLGARIQQAELATLIASLGLVVLLALLVFFSLQGYVSLSNTIVIFLALRLQNTTFSSVSSSLMRFARAKANSF